MPKLIFYRLGVLSGTLSAKYFSGGVETIDPLIYAEIQIFSFSSLDLFRVV